MTSQSALIGQPVEELDTPALLVDLDIMEANISHMASFMGRHGVNWRPHTKGVKVPAIAKQELAAGAFGVTCAKLGDAEAMAAAGVDNILIANQVVGTRKIERLVALVQRGTTVLVAVESPGNALALSAAAAAAGVSINVLVEVNVGMDRCGLPPHELAVAFARRLHELPGLTLRGVMAWEGHTGRIEDPEEKKRGIEDAVGMLVETAEECRAAGLPCEIVSCGERSPTTTRQRSQASPRCRPAGASSATCSTGAAAWITHRAQSAGDGRQPSHLAAHHRGQRLKAFGQPVVDPHPRDIENVASLSCRQSTARSSWIRRTTPCRWETRS